MVNPAFAGVEVTAFAPDKVRPLIVVAALVPAINMPPEAPGVAAATLLMFLTLTSGTPAVAGDATTVLFQLTTFTPN